MGNYDGKWVDVVFMQDDEGWEMVDKLMRTDGFVMQGMTEESIAEVVEYLAQWDFGQETDDAHTEDYGNRPPWAGDDIVECEDGYILTYNTRLGYVSLNRRPMDY